MIETLCKAFSAKFRRSLRRVIDSLSAVGARAFAANRGLASLYYFAFSRRFDREHLAVLRGRQAYARSLKALGESSPLLRRNVHRLEKGLIMQPRRTVFAEDYILETVRIFNRALEKLGFAEGELHWAKDVLDEYFAIVKDTPSIRKARLEYLEGNVGLRNLGMARAFKPYPLSARPEQALSFDQLSSLFVRRRSVRWYQKKPVPTDLIQKAINAAALAPSACNRQPYRFIVADNSLMASKIAECAGGTVGFAQQVPAVIVVLGDLSAYPFERDRHLIYIDASLASMQLMLAAETLGLSTCPINWPDVESSEKRLQAILQFEEYERVVMLISIGFGDPDGGIAYSQKKYDASITQKL